MAWRKYSHCSRQVSRGSAGRGEPCTSIPSEAIITETQGASTVESTVAAVEIMRRMNLRSCIVVSDGYHIYRVKKMLQSRGLKVYGSPRPSQLKGGWREDWLYVRQSVGYGLWRIGVNI